MRYALHALYGVVLSPSGLAATATVGAAEVEVERGSLVCDPAEGQTSCLCLLGLARGFYVWNRVLSKWRSRESDEIVAAVRHARALHDRLTSCWARWHTLGVLGAYLFRWVAQADSALRGEWRRRVALRWCVERTFARLRQAFRHWAGSSLDAASRRRILPPALRRWAASVARRRLGIWQWEQLLRVASSPACRLASMTAWRRWRDVHLWEMVAYSAALRGDIRALERTVLQWRLWATAMSKWTRWAGELRRRATRRIAPTVHEQQRASAWRAGAGIRWSVAASGFAAELHGAVDSSCLDGAVEVWRDADGKRMADLALSPCAPWLRLSHPSVTSYPIGY